MIGYSSYVVRILLELLIKHKLNLEFFVATLIINLLLYLGCKVIIWVIILRGAIEKYEIVSL